MKYFPFLCLLSASPALADTLFCRADFDESSHYELSSHVKNRGEVEFRYVTDDGMDLHAALKIRSQLIEPQKKVTVNAANENMGATIDAVFDAASNTYIGKMGVSFELQHAEPLSLDANCILN